MHVCLDEPSFLDFESGSCFLGCESCFLAFTWVAGFTFSFWVSFIKSSGSPISSQPIRKRLETTIPYWCSILIVPSKYEGWLKIFAAIMSRTWLCDTLPKWRYNDIHTRYNTAQRYAHPVCTIKLRYMQNCDVYILATICAARSTERIEDITGLVTGLLINGAFQKGIEKY